MQALQLKFLKFMDHQTVNLLFSIFAAHNPSPKIELKYHNHFTLITAIILSARSTDVSVNKITDTLFKIADTPTLMLKLGEENLKKQISKIGLYNAKARHIIDTSRILCELYGGNVPMDFDKLITLPGVGRKSANVFLNAACGYETIGVDTHVLRVSNRLGLIKEKTPEKAEQALLLKIPLKWRTNAHNWLVLHGRYVCKARQPLCQQCLVSNLCEFNKQHQTSVNSKYHT